MRKVHLNLKKCLFFLIFSLAACSSTKSDRYNPYLENYASLSYAEQKKASKNLESFYEAMREKVLLPISSKQEDSHPVLKALKTSEDSKWFDLFNETLIGAELMAKSNSFRSYSNAECYESFVRPLGIEPFPNSSELMSLYDFMKAGPRIPTEPIYVQQVRLFCGRSSINKFEGFETAARAKIYLTLSHNRSLKKYVLHNAEEEAALILEAFRAALLD